MHFDIERPSTIADAVKALKNEDAQALGGGQTLIPTLKQRLAMPSALVSLTGIGEMKGVCLAMTVLYASAARPPMPPWQKRRQRIIRRWRALPANIGDPAVRNRGTIGGSLANNDPSACYPAAALGSGATIITNTREIAADDYFQGMFETALEEGEVITEVRFPVPEKSNYQKFVQPASRFALVGVFVAKYADGVRVAVTGASENGVFRWSEAEAALSADFSAAALEGLDGVCRRNDRRFARIARISRPSDQSHDRARGHRCVLNQKAPAIAGAFFIQNCSVLLRQWSDQHDHLAAFHLGEVFDLASLFGVFGDTFQQFAAQFLVRHFAAPETQGDLHLVAVFQKLEDVAHLDFVVVGVRVGTELDFLDLDDLLLLAGLGFLLLSLVLELAIVHDLANRRVGVWRNFHQIQPGFFGHFHGACGGNNANIFAVGADQADFGAI